jgi:hypothetical protein
MVNDEQIRVGRDRAFDRAQRCVDGGRDLSHRTTVRDLKSVQRIRIVWHARRAKNLVEVRGDRTG